ncbi:uncharacterized protein LOC112462227 [Temnothorax curvispinosus]|uniref:Uncharacterized protein LOC112462227 n=1 Tax=Temnothorax curvispinosus TaxID=300111 RepID=A0A6J1QRQ0_9HYME|nr:uncharacterized protein LOC112462227 [Temnothorax curvispinosus]
MEEEGQDALVDYDSDSSFITVIDREAKDKNEETVRKDREAKDKKKMERRGAIPKKNLPKVRENIDVTKAWEENRPVLPIGTKILYEKQEKLVAKMDNSMQMLDKVMTKATEMMENMVEVSRLNLEKEKVKLRRLELEAETKNENREKLEKPEVRVQRAAAEENMKQVKCYRCNRMGHMAKDCPLIESGFVTTARRYEVTRVIIVRVPKPRRTELEEKGI